MCSPPPPSAAFWQLGELSVEQGDVGAGGRCMGTDGLMVVGGLCSQGEVAELLETTPGVEIE